MEIIGVLIKLIRLYEYVIIGEALLSWVIQDRTNEIMNLLRTFTNPILEPFRKLQYKYFGNVQIDISPIFAIIALNILIGILSEIAYMLY